MAADRFRHHRGCILVALIAVLVRLLWKKNAKKRAKTESYYGGYNKNARYTPKKSSDGIEAPENTTKDFDYDNLENNLENGDNNDTNNETKE